MKPSYDCYDCPDSDDCIALLTGVCSQMTNEIDLTKTEAVCNDFNTTLGMIMACLDRLRQDKSSVSLDSIKSLMNSLTDIETMMVEKLSPIADRLYDVYTADLEHYVRENEK